MSNHMGQYYMHSRTQALLYHNPMLYVYADAN